MALKTKAPSTFRDQLLKAVNQVDRPGSICTARDRPLTMPGLEVEGIGTIRLPLGTVQARELIGKCSQAPYGKGTETLVDTDVRRVWELDPKQFDLVNPQWSELVSSITGEVQESLGLEKAKLTAHLYKLLVYEKGSFFLPHRDGEKLDGMVATLVVCLPSQHTGGELIVSHEGQRQEIAFKGAASGHELSYAAFYADCEHEVRPVRGGYRLCLVYNLTLARSGAKKGIMAPRTGKAVAAVSTLFREWPSAGELPKAAITLDHQYSQEGLTIDTLKGVDRARADVLFEAAEQSDCVAHLAQITHWQSGSAEGGDYDYSYGHRRYWSDDDDDDADESGGSSDHAMGEIYDQSLSASHWSDRDGKKIALGEMSLDEGEIVSSEPLDDWDVGREEFEGYTGNAGMTLELWYHRAAIVVWPRKNHFRVLSAAGTDAAIAGLESMVKKWRRARKSEAEQQRASCVQFATAIIETWGPRGFNSGSYERQEPIDRPLFPLLLQELDAAELVRRFLAQVMPKVGDVQIDKSFPAYCKKHGWPTFAETLAAIMEGSSAATIARNVALLEIICVQRDKDAERIEISRHLAEHAVAALLRLERSAKRDWQMEQIDRAALLTMFVKSLTAVEAAQPLTTLIDHTLSQGAKYDLTDVQLKAIFALESWLTRASVKPDRSVSRWLAHCRTELEKRTATAPCPPADFRRNNKLSCTCRDCSELSKFLADPGESVHHFPLAKDRRQHLHQIIEAAGCDLTHVTSRTGRPFTLVCTKTTASHKKSCEIYERDQENLKRLRAIEAKVK